MSEETLGVGQTEKKDLKQYEGDKGLAARWLKEISLVRDSKQQKSFENQGYRIIKIYKNADIAISNAENTSRCMVNVLWSNVQVLAPSYYARIPKVIVERTFKDSDPIGRLAAEIAERATHYSNLSEQDNLNFAFRSVVKDRLLPGRGIAWLKYDAEFIEQKDSNGEPIVDEKTGAVVKQIKPNSENVKTEYVFWCDYFEATARNSQETRWRARRVYMNRAELVSRFGKQIGEAVSLGMEKKSRKKFTDEETEFLAQAEIYEVWDKTTQKVYWVSEGYTEGCLDCKPDPLKLKGFWPCPDPLLATTTTDSNYPTPDYRIYEKLADEVDWVSKRISAIVDCIKFVGAVSAAHSVDVKNILSLKDGTLWPVKDFANWSEKGGFKGVLDWLPFDQCVAAINPLMAYQQSLLSQIDLTIGIPDIARGKTDPNETAEAQQRKSQWTVLKIEDSQADVQRFARQIISKKAEIIFEPGLFSDETIALMAGVSQMTPEKQQQFPAALKILRDDRLRTFRMDIETDSTIASDEDADRKARMEYLASISQIASTIKDISAFRPELMQPIVESALFVSRSFRAGRPIEGAWERAFDLIEQADKQAKENPPPPPPDYQQMQIEIMQRDVAVKEQTAQAKQMYDQSKLQMDAQSEQMNFAIEQQKNSIAEMKVQLDGQLKAQAIQSKAQIDQMWMQLEKFREDFSQFITKQKLEFEAYQAAKGEEQQAFENALGIKSKQHDELMASVSAINDHIKSISHHTKAKADLVAASVPDTPSEVGE